MAAQASERPRVRVAGLALIDGRVVLVRHRSGNARYHLLPGGGVGWGETLPDALTREFAEETGLVCEVGRPLVISDTIDPEGRRHIVNITFAVSITGGSITDAPDDPRVEAVETVDVDALGRLDLRPPLHDVIAEAARMGDAFQAAYAGSRYVPDVQR